MRERTGTAAAGGARGGPPSRGRYVRPPWWRRNLGVLLTVGGVVMLVAAFIIAAQIQNRQASIGIGDPAPASVVKAVTTVSPTVSAKVGAGTALNAFQATPKGTAVLMANGKPEIIYVGAEWCPYCAATRWSTVVALSRFGSFNGLTLMKSSSNDTLPDTNTFSFQHATYTSQYISFSATEDSDRDRNPLATPPPSAAHALATYDVPPYTTAAGGIPFMSYANQYVTTSGLFIPTMLQGLSWQQIAAQLNNPNSDVTKAIVGGANYQTAAICTLTNNQPGSVCSAPEIQQLETKLPQPK
jgi:thiol-disulfide isomerase/thioredoxin